MNLRCICFLLFLFFCYLPSGFDSAYKQTGVCFIVVVIIVVVIVLHHRMNRESLVGLVTRLRGGQPSVLSSIRGMAKTFFSERFRTALVSTQPHF